MLGEGGGLLACAGVEVGVGSGVGGELSAVEPDEGADVVDEEGLQVSGPGEVRGGREEVGREGVEGGEEGGAGCRAEDVHVLQGGTDQGVRVRVRFSARAHAHGAGGGGREVVLDVVAHDLLEALHVEGAGVVEQHDGAAFALQRCGVEGWREDGDGGDVVEELRRAAAWRG